MNPEVGFNNLVQNMQPLKKVESLSSLKNVKVSLKDFDITGEQEFITIAFTDEDLQNIKNGDLQFVAVSGRRS